jgi:hypothetical protein
MNRKNGLLVLTGVALLFGVLSFMSREPVQAAEQGGAGSPKYTVVETQGHNLLVTDNSTNTLYYYTIDKDKEIGSDLKLRASVELKQVGSPVIHITKAATK